MLREHAQGAGRFVFQGRAVFGICSQFAEERLVQTFNFGVLFDEAIYSETRKLVFDNAYETVSPGHSRLSKMYGQIEFLESDN